MRRPLRQELQLALTAAVESEDLLRRERPQEIRLAACSPHLPHALHGRSLLFPRRLVIVVVGVVAGRLLGRFREREERCMVSPEEKNGKERVYPLVEPLEFEL